MKICGIICEFNPFHNGHAYFLEQARKISGCDFLVCVMSGNFTQRGEICILDKYTRAKHAVLGGADCVLELPAAFSVAPAEIFAEGAIKILSSIPNLNSIAFGCENADRKKLLAAARILNEEPAKFKEILTENLDSGQSYIKSRQIAFSSVGGDEDILNRPNNILAVEYVKAILKNAENIEIYPIERVGSGYNDVNLSKNYSSATAIRNNLLSPQIKNNAPPFVFADLKDFSDETKKYDEYLRLILTRTSPEKLQKICGCNEGLENSIKKYETQSLNGLIQSVTSKRYTSSRIKRILCANFLNLYKEDCENFLKTDLYFKPLAVKSKSANEILAQISLSNFPIVTSGSDTQKLNETAKKCKDCDDFSFKQWKLIANSNVLDKLIII